jgi:hypothetical protein
MIDDSPVVTPMKYIVRTLAFSGSSIINLLLRGP